MDSGTTENSDGDHPDPLQIAAEAVVSGQALEGDWETLAALCSRDGVESVAARLQAVAGPTGPSARWWRCNLLLTMEISASDALALTNELLEIEAAGGGPPDAPDRHALEVSAVVRFLQTHLQRVLAGRASPDERRAALAVVRAARVAQVKKGRRALTGRR